MRTSLAAAVALAAVALATVAAACTGSPSDGEPRAADSTAPADDREGPAVIDGVANGLILVHDPDGGANTLASYRPDGTIVTTYGGEGGDVVWQPIWSPDGRRVAWTSSTDGASWELVTAAVDGGDRTTHPLPGRPDYIAYDPTASRVLALTPSPEGFGLVVVELEEAPTGERDTTRAIDLGQPYFSDFSPGGDRVIAHVGPEMRVVDVDGERVPLEFSSVGHQTPAWHPSEDLVFFATDDERGNRLVSHDLTDGVTTELATFNAFVLFALDPTGTRLAVSVFGGETDGGVVALSRSRAQPAVLDSGLWIVEVADGSATRLDVRPTTAPTWDPSGTRVLARTGLDGVGRWIVHGLAGEETATEEFDVDGTSLPAYLPFWDQFARSQTVWSPDGAMFTHVGRDPGGEDGVWVHDAATSGPSTLLAEGDLAFWSPT